MIIPKPTSAQCRQLLRLLDNTDAPQRRRKAEAVWFYALGFNVQDIARALAMPPNSIYARLHVLEQDGLTAVPHVQRGGTQPRITPQQGKTLCGLAQQSPHERGFSFGRGTLSPLQEYAIWQRHLKTISREGLRQVLKKTASTCARGSPNWLDVLS